MEVSPVSHVNQLGVRLHRVLDEGLDARLPAGEDALAVVRRVVWREMRRLQSDGLALRRHVGERYVVGVAVEEVLQGKQHGVVDGLRHCH